jgi:hypothetical protein
MISQQWFAVDTLLASVKVESSHLTNFTNTQNLERGMRGRGLY